MRLFIIKKYYKIIIYNFIIYFCYYNGEVDSDYSAYFELSNNTFLSERNFGPAGVNNVGLIIFNQEQFTEESRRLSDIGVIVKRFENETR